MASLPGKHACIKFLNQPNGFELNCLHTCIPKIFLQRRALRTEPPKNSTNPSVNIFELMDNRGFQKEPEKDIRIQMQETGQPTTSAAVTTTSTATSTSAVKVCRPDVCRRARLKYTQSRETSESPWHRKKTIFLITFIVLLICWAIVYGVLSRLGVL